MRQIAFLMHASKGALSHHEIMQLSWRQFLVYIDSFTWLLREQTEQGRVDNARDDLLAMSRDPRIKERKQKMVDETKQKVASMKKRKKKAPVKVVSHLLE